MVPTRKEILEERLRRYAAWKEKAKSLPIIKLDMYRNLINTIEGTKRMLNDVQKDRG